MRFCDSNVAYDQFVTRRLQPGETVDVFLAELAPPNLKTQHSSSVSYTFRWLTLNSVPHQMLLYVVNRNHVLIYENVIEVRRSRAVHNLIMRQHSGKHRLHHTGCHIQSKPQPREVVHLTTKDHSLVGPQGFVDSYLQVRSVKVNNRHDSSYLPPLSYLASTNICVLCERIHVRVQFTEIHHLPYLVFTLLNDRHQGNKPFCRRQLLIIIRLQPPVNYPLLNVFLVAQSGSSRDGILCHPERETRRRPTISM